MVDYPVGTISLLKVLLKRQIHFLISQLFSCMPRSFGNRSEQKLFCRLLYMCTLDINSFISTVNECFPTDQILFPGNVVSLWHCHGYTIVASCTHVESHVSHTHLCCTNIPQASMRGVIWRDVVWILAAVATVNGMQ